MDALSTTVLGAMSEAMVVVQIDDGTPRALAMSRAAAEILGLGRDALTGQPLALVAPALAELVGRVAPGLDDAGPEQILAGAVAARDGQRYTLAIRRATDAALLVCSLRPGEPADRRDPLEPLLAASTLMVARCTVDTTVTFCNEAFARCLGRARDHVQGQRLLDLLSPTDTVDLLGNLALLTAQAPARSYLRREEGRGVGEHWEEWTDVAVFDAAGQLVEYQRAGRDVTARHRIEGLLRGSEQRLQVALAAGRQAVWQMELSSGEVVVDEQLRTWLQLAPGQAVPGYAEWLERIHPDDRAGVEAGFAQLIADEVDRYGAEYRLIRPDGSYRWLLEYATVAERDEAGRPTQVIGTSADVSERKVTDAQLLEGERRLRLALDAGELSIWEFDVPTGRLRLDARTATRVGLPSGTWLPIAQGLARVHPDDRRQLGRAVEALSAGRTDRYVLELRRLESGGEPFWVEDHGIVAERHPDGGPRRLIGVSRDITARKQAELELARMARLDPLTGLANRRALFEDLDAAVARAMRSRLRVALLVLDLHGFKDINDRWGHPTGDEVLVEIAQRLRLSIRTYDRAARLGGDEFAVITDDLRSDRTLTRLATRIRQSIRRPIAVGGYEVRLDIGIGIAVYPEAAGSATALVAAADAALYVAKRSGAGWTVAPPRGGLTAGMASAPKAG